MEKVYRISEVTERKLNNFCGVMTSIKKSLGRWKSKRACKTDYLTLFTNYRSEGTDTLTSPTRKKPRRMETSTPKTTRNQHRGEANKELIESPVEPSPISHKSSDQSSENGGDGLIAVGSPTQVSGEIKLLIMTPPVVESESQEERQVAYQSHVLTWAAVTRGIIKKTNSLPNLVSSTSMNAIFRPYSTRVNETSGARLRVNSVGGVPSVSIDSIDFTQWSSNDFNHEKIVGYYGEVVNKLGEKVNKLEISDVEESKSTEPSTASETEKSARAGGMVTDEKTDAVERVIKPGGLALGLKASEDVLQQPATPAGPGIKRNLGGSAERKTWKQRKLSFNGRELSPASWRGDTVENEIHLSTPRRSTWSSPSTGMRRRCKARRNLKVHGQPLIKEMLGFDVSDKVPEVLDDEKQDVKSNDHQNNSLEKSKE